MHALRSAAGLLVALFGASFGALFGACSRSSDAPRSIAALAARWPANCKQLQARLGPAADVTFSPPPTALGSQPDWSLSLAGLHVGVPAARYDVFVTRSPQHLSVILRAGRCVVMVTDDPPAAVLRDVLGQVGELPDARREAFTTLLYGKLPTMYDVLERGYRHRRGDLSCSASEVKESIPVGIGLALKTLGPGRSSSMQVYDRPFGLPRTMATAGQLGADLWAVDLHVERATRSHIVTYRVPRAEEARLTPSVRVSLQGLSNAQPVPPWFLALRGALAGPSVAERWRALQAALQTRGADPRSLLSVGRLATPTTASQPASRPMLAR